MCDPVTLSVAATAIAGGVAAKGQYDQGRVAKQVGRNNQVMAEYAAQDAQRRAGEDAIKVQQKAAQLKGVQRATMAAKGLDLGVGTQGEILDQTDFFGATDAATTRDNGNRAAWSARASGDAARAQGDAAARQANMQAFSTVLGTASSVAGKWYAPSSTGYDFNKQGYGDKY